MSITTSIYNATWGRVFARVYEWSLAATEDAGMRGYRRDLLSRAEGRTLEVGAGTGFNLEHYPDSVTELIATEPFEPMARQLRAKLAARSGGPATEVIEASADGLPVADASVDTVVCTLVLCTVDDPAATLAEVDRVLKPGGRLLFCEHVRSDDPDSARWQDRLMRPWKAFGHGCRCNRDTLSTIAASPLEVDEVEHGTLPKAPPIVRPRIQGSAVKV